MLLARWCNTTQAADPQPDRLALTLIAPAMHLHLLFQRSAATTLLHHRSSPARVRPTCTDSRRHPLTHRHPPLHNKYTTTLLHWDAANKHAARALYALTALHAKSYKHTALSPPPQAQPRHTQTVHAAACDLPAKPLLPPNPKKHGRPRKLTGTAGTVPRPNTWSTSCNTPSVLCTAPHAASRTLWVHATGSAAGCCSSAGTASYCCSCSPANNASYLHVKRVQHSSTGHIRPAQRISLWLASCM